ncbi:3-isopropylmalate dehydratase large subunit [Tistrella mobilis]|uniref:3-isopropylmalate dehydratase large subunit n=1 Tax=Tistrella mobilis TaxID=171437 RepID=UPI003557A1FC
MTAAVMPSSGQSLVDKIWAQHVIRDLGDCWALIHIDRHILHDLSGPPALGKVQAAGRRVSMPGLTFATPDHAVSSRPGRTAASFPPGGRLIEALRDLTAHAGIRLFDLDEDGQGIVHVTAPELGISLPGLTVICGDSHTCTHGGLGALAFGVGTSESAHALATQTLRMQKPRRMRVLVEGRLGTHVTAKDLALHLMRRLGSAAGVGHTVEYAGSAVRALGVEARLTLCNLSVEMGARSGLIAPDDTVFGWLAGRDYAPKGGDFDQAVAVWRDLASDEDAVFDREAVFDAAEVAPTISWGTSPDQSIAIDEAVPDPDRSPATSREGMRAALDYMGLEPGRPLIGTPVDWVFVGSCANARIEDLRAAAAIARTGRVAPGVTAWVVPGSVRVKREAEAEGLDRVFREAGFAWREPGCAMCVAANGEQVPPGARSVSTSNRNFVGRQGPRARTHLASPATAAAAALAGRIVDVRTHS